MSFVGGAKFDVCRTLLTISCQLWGLNILSPLGLGLHFVGGVRNQQVREGFAEVCGGPRPGFFVEALRPTVGNTVGITTPSSAHCPIKAREAEKIQRKLIHDWVLTRDNQVIFVNHNLIINFIRWWGSQPVGQRGVRGGLRGARRPPPPRAALSRPRFDPPPVWGVRCGVLQRGFGGEMFWCVGVEVFVWCGLGSVFGAGSEADLHVIRPRLRVQGSGFRIQGVGFRV